LVEAQTKLLQDQLVINRVQQSSFLLENIFPSSRQDPSSEYESEYPFLFFPRYKRLLSTFFALFISLNQTTRSSFKVLTLHRDRKVSEVGFTLRQLQQEIDRIRELRIANAGEIVYHTNPKLL
jgi:hypothetical protein